MSTRKSELTRQAARLFAEKGYHGTSIGDLAEAMGVQKGSLYAHIDSKADLLWEVARDGAAAFHAGLDTVPDELPATEKIRFALRAHLRVIGEQLEIATVFIREWRYLEGTRRDEFVAERRRYEDRFRALFREGRELGELRTDLDDATATLLAPCAATPLPEKPCLMPRVSCSRHEAGSPDREPASEPGHRGGHFGRRACTDGLGVLTHGENGASTPCRRART